MNRTERFQALVQWPSAPLTNTLVRNALAVLDPAPSILSSLPEDLAQASGNILQWSTYDAIDHALTHSYPTASRVLSSSYTIRKALIRKHFLSRCIHNYITKHPATVLQAAVPRTWELELSYADELDELWGDDLYDLGEEIDKQDPRMWWILKPGMADRGMGLRIFHSKADLMQIFEEFDEADTDLDQDGEEEGTNTGVVTSQLRHFVVQEYLANPLLLDPSEVPLEEEGKHSISDSKDLRGHKFHLRAYVIASGAISVYLYERILALFSAVPYAPPAASVNGNSGKGRSSIDLSAHLTNTSLQTDRGEAGVRLLDELIGCQILGSPSADNRPVSSANGGHGRRPGTRRAMGQALDVDQIRAARAEEATKKVQVNGAVDAQRLTPADVDDIKSQIAEVLSETFKAALDMSVHFQPLPNAFELYGIDFLVTHSPNPKSSRKFQVHLLEVNSEPAIELTGPRLTWILEDLFGAIGRTCITPFFRTPNGEETESEGTWVVNTIRDNLRKCLEVEVRGAGGW